MKQEINVIKKLGFTLIELLVVVLIIGILAAVALPQYNKAVKKAQGAEVLAALDALDKNLSAYYLEHDTYNGSGVEKFTVNVPQLHHFKYLVGSTFRYDKGNFEFTNQNLTNTRWLEGEHVAMVEFFSPDSVRVSGTWMNGKLYSWQCRTENDSSSVSCGDYFNCGAGPRVQISSDIFGTMYHGWQGGDCYLKKGIIQVGS